MRLQKFMALCGAAARRKCEEMIAAGKVTVNGQIVREQGVQVDENADRVELEGRVLRIPEKKRTILFYKPACCVCTVSDPQKRQTVMDYIKGVPERIYPVGRLDYMTEGLLLLTNDGDMAQYLMHPKNEREKTYRADVVGEVTAQEIARLEAGVELSDGLTSPAKVWIAGKKNGVTTVMLTIHEGRNRQIRRMLEAVQKEVIYLCRQGYAGLTLEGLKPGAFRDLSKEEIAAIYPEANFSK